MNRVNVQSYRTAADLNGGGGTDPAQWVAYAECQDESFVCGVGDTQKQAEEAARGRAVERNTFLSSGPRERLREVLARAPGSTYLLAADLTHAIKAIAEILLGEKA
jgi:hypothetical protein